MFQSNILYIYEEIISTTAYILWISKMILGISEIERYFPCVRISDYCLVIVCSERGRIAKA